MEQLANGTNALDVLHKLDAGLDEKSAQQSRSLINALFVLMRSAAMHDLSNDALNRPFEAMRVSVSEFFEHSNDPVEIAMVDGNFFMNGRLIELDYSTYENIQHLKRVFKALSIDELKFNATPTNDDLMKFLRAFVEVLSEPTRRITTYDLDPIRPGVRHREEFAALFGAEDPRHHVLGVYASGLLMLRHFVNDLRKGRAPRYSKIKRLCLQLIDLEPRYHNLLIVLIHLDGYKGNLFCHMLNTAILAISFGHRVGLNRGQLLDLGMAAFYHDLAWALLGTLDDQGETELNLTIEGINRVRNKQGYESDELRVKVARALVRIGGFNDLIINRLIVAYETQIPTAAKPEGLYYGDIDASFMTHVIRMAATYDSLTTPMENRLPMRPDQAMKQIMDDGGRTFDPFLAKLFVNSLGYYPVGTLVELDSGELGLVVNLPSDPVGFDRPQVKILVDRSGRHTDEGRVIDLNQKNRTGHYARTVERTYDCRPFGVNLTNFFFGDA
ncbi:MAG: hypothetical protein VX589_15285 [Myxococcota bacterium]|nr:hypothetical protein [Myxococcota bacterium]